MWHRMGPYFPEVLGICLCLLALLLVPLVGPFNETALQRRMKEVALKRETSVPGGGTATPAMQCPAAGSKGRMRCDTPG